MATKIALLPDDVIDQIAAGEVIERPASVLRELLDNALDAEADRIVVEFEDGGVSSIMVLDNGVGMSPEDAERAIQRHATSKIRSLADLQGLGSRGFRGEALASIAAVSRFSLCTREPTAESATTVHCETANCPIVTTTAGQPGTRVEVHDLFCNIPARRKFLKSTPTETAHINKVFLRAALSRPDVRFELRRSGHRSKLMTSTDALGRAEQAFEHASLVSLAPQPINGIVIRAYLAPAQKARNGAAHLHLFVNGRPVLDKGLARSVAFAYGSSLDPGKFPLGAVYLEVEPETVDINVHPQKLEVRFSDARRVHEAITRALARALGTQPWERRETSLRPLRSHERPSGKARYGQTAPHYSTNENAWASLSVLRDATLSPASEKNRSHVERSGPFASLRPIAQAKSLFIVCEGPDGLYVLDQHAADERIRFAALKRQLAGEGLAVQRLLFPAQAEVSAKTLAWLENRDGALAKLGIDASPISDSGLLVRAIPALLTSGDPRRLVKSALAEMMREGVSESAKIEKALAAMACEAALRRGQRISLRECADLLVQLDATEPFANLCVHGKPVVFTISFSDLEKHLDR